MDRDERQEAARFLEGFTYDTNIHECRQKHDPVFAALSEQVHNLMRLDLVLGTYKGVEATVELVKIAYQLGYRDGINSVVYKDKQE